jgi:hypothetical protein
MVAHAVSRSKSSPDVESVDAVAALHAVGVLSTGALILRRQRPTCATFAHAPRGNRLARPRDEMRKAEEGIREMHT